jgi:serine/threonine protein kinase
MEVCEEGNLLEVLRSKDDVTGKPTALDVPALAADIAAAILYMHRRGVAHRDIKSPNVLLVSFHSFINQVEEE